MEQNKKKTGTKELKFEGKTRVCIVKSKESRTWDNL